jgi:hypothetical protein
LRRGKLLLKVTNKRKIRGHHHHFHCSIWTGGQLVSSTWLICDFCL